MSGRDGLTLIGNMELVDQGVGEGHDHKQTLNQTCMIQYDFIVCLGLYSYRVILFVVKE